MKSQFDTTGTTVAQRLSTSKDRLVSDSKGAVQEGLELVAGQTALSVLRSFVIPAKISLVDRLTGKGRFIAKVVNSAYGSLAIAATAHVAVTIIAPQNDKLQRICQLALKAAVVEATATLPIQEWTDKLAAKLFSAAPIAKLIGDDKTDGTDA